MILDIMVVRIDHSHIQNFSLAFVIFLVRFKVHFFLWRAIPLKFKIKGKSQYDNAWIRIRLLRNLTKLFTSRYNNMLYYYLCTNKYNTSYSFFNRDTFKAQYYIVILKPIFFILIRHSFDSSDNVL